MQPGPTETPADPTSEPGATAEPTAEPGATAEPTQDIGVPGATEEPTAEPGATAEPTQDTARQVTPKPTAASSGDQDRSSP
jgi:hypothetical protein